MTTSLDNVAASARNARMVIVTKPPSNIVRCKSAHLHYLCARAREDERIQYAALSGHDEYDPDRAWYEFTGLMQQGPHFTALDDENMPAAAGGYHCVFPGVWQSWMVGTQSGWDQQWRSITKGCRWLADALFDQGARRLQTSALASRTHAIEWYLKGLKMTPCGVWSGYGKNGEDVANFQRIHPDIGGA
jgi:hypothetical protein